MTREAARTDSRNTNSAWLIEKVKVAAETVFGEMGTGHTEVIYEAALEVELGIKFGPVRRQVPCPISYKEVVIGTGVIDILVDKGLIVEIKAVNKLSFRDETQVKKYLNSSGLDRGVLINFGPELEIWEVSRKTPTNDTDAED